MSGSSQKLLVLIFCLGICLTGCSTGHLADRDWSLPRVEKVWPEAPSTPRIRYIRMIDPENLSGKPSGTTNFFQWVSGESADVVPLLTPYAVAADGHGVVWVSDTESAMIHRFNLVTGRVDYWRAIGGRNLFTPVGLLFEPSRQQLFIVDSGLRKVFIVSADGELISEISPPHGFQRPVNVTVGPEGQIYVVDAKAGKVEVFDKTGQFLQSLGSQLTQGGTFNTPLSVAVDQSGLVFVNDSLNFQIEVLNASGGSHGNFGGIGDSPGSFARPRGIALDSDGHLYVVDAAFGNVQIFDSGGQLLLHFGQWGEQVGEFSLPAGICIDVMDRIYVVDSYNHRVQIFQYLPVGH